MKKLNYIAVYGVMLTNIVSCSDPSEKVQNYLERGKQYYQANQLDKSKIEFKNAIQINNKLAEAFFYLALIEEKNKNWPVMYANLDQVIKNNPNHIDARLKLAKLKLLSEQIKEASEDVDVVLSQIPDNIDALIIKGAIFLKQGDKTSAQKLVDKVLALAPDNFDAISLQVAIFINNGDKISALNLVEKKLKNNPNEPGLYLLKLQIVDSLDDKNALEKTYQALVKQFPENLDYQFAFAKFYSEIARDHDADAILSKIIESHPENKIAKLIYIDFLSQKSPLLAISKARDYIEKKLGDEDIQLVLARLLIREKSLSEAQEVLNRLIKESNDNKNILSAKTLSAIVALQSNDQATAQKWIDEILALDSRYYDAMLLQAKIKLSNNKVDEAISYLRSILRDYPDKDELYVMLAKSYIYKGDNALADENFRKALDINPANFDAVLPVVTKMVGSKDLNRAEEVLKKALQFQPHHQEALKALGQVRILKQDWLGTKQVADIINSTSKDTAYAHYLSARISHGQNHCDLAVNQYRQALSMDPNLFDALNSLVFCYEKLNQRDIMFKFLEDFIKKNPSVDYALAVKSRLLVMDGRVNEAISLLSDAISKKPVFSGFYELLAQIYLSEKNNQQAINILKEGLESIPNSPDLLMQLASVYEQSGDYYQALNVYEKILSAQPHFDIAINNLVSLLLDHFPSDENFARSLLLAERFKDSTQPFFLDSYAWALFKNGKIEEAMQIAKRVIKQAPDVPVFRYHLGAIYAKQGNKIAAEKELKKALDLNDNGQSLLERAQVEKLLFEINS